MTVNIISPQATLFARNECKTVIFFGLKNYNKLPAALQSEIL
jgi:hypothetical protein